MSTQDKLNQIANLRSQIATLKDQVNKADVESKKQVEKRDQLNEQTKKVNLEIRDIKKQRDEINQKVQALKQQRDDVRVKIKPIMDEIQAINEKKEELKKKAPRVRQKDIQEEINKIDWKIQTESLDLQEEKRLVGEVKLLETQLSGYKKIEKQNKKIAEHIQERKVLDAQADKFHKELSEMAKKSQDLHESMIAKIAEAKKAKEEADVLHKGFIENKEKIKALLVDIAVITGQMLGLQNTVREQNKELREKEMAIRLKEKEQFAMQRNKKLLDEQALKTKLGAQAKEKLNKGEKLSWNEFQLLAGDDEAEDADTQK
ncbi:MAG: coiled-coil protein [Candidatus Bathyarchaeia archaeon]